MIGMVLAFVLSALVGLCADRQGIASQYDPGVMERVVRFQQRRGRLPADVSEWDGFVAVPDCAEIGRTLYLRPAGARRWERFLVADCAGPDGSFGWMVRNRILVEVDGATAVRWNTVGRGIPIEIMVASGESWPCGGGGRNGGRPRTRTWPVGCDGNGEVWHR